MNGERVLELDEFPNQAELIEAVAHHIRGGHNVDVEDRTRDVGEQLAYRIAPRGDARLVFDLQGKHQGTFADVAAAVRHAATLPKLTPPPCTAPFSQ